MNILVTGANGLLGQKIIEQTIFSDKHSITATSKGPERYRFKDISYQYLPMDITDASNVQEVISNIQPEVVINTAAVTQVDQCEGNHDHCYRVNYLGVRNLVEASKIYPFQLVQLSTDFVFDGRNGPYIETDIPSPISYYGKCKHEAENLVISELKNAAIIRTILVYGVSPQMSRSNLVWWVRESLMNGKEIKVVDDQYRTPTLVEDLADACLIIAERQQNGIYHIGGPDTLTPYQMAVMTAQCFGLDTTLIHKVNADTFRQPAKRPPRTGLIIEKAKKELGYNPLDFKAGLKVIAKQIGKYQLQ